MSSLSRGTAFRSMFKFISPLKGSRKRHYQYTAVDDCTRLRVLRLYTRANQKTSIQFIDYVLQWLPFRVELIQTDNGAEFQAAFHWHVTDRGIPHVYIKPATPRLNGKVERSHRIDDEEFYRQLNGIVVDNTELFNQRLQEMGALLQLRPSTRRPQVKLQRASARADDSPSVRSTSDEHWLQDR